ncbi:hypothetical protein [Geotalea sp. SG265]|uniref:hypothetical protein n=1 Tax=Geotalea sp. SG265 TaxID=2922867 RepID=UPI001FAF1545|nr:hypothetical protein [Geotalea sp. SG265]
MKIALFAYETRNLNTFPSIVAAIRVLSSEGHSVDLYLPFPMSTEINIVNCRIFIVSDADQYNYVKKAARLARNLGIPYDLFFAYYIEGLIVSEILSNKKNSIQIVYFSMELIYKNYPSRLISNIINPNKLLAALLRSLITAARNDMFTIQRFRELLSAYLKEFLYSILALRSWWRLSHQSYKRILFSVVSDHMRAKVLKEEFPFVNDIIYVPEAGYIGYNDQKSDYAFNRYGIPPYKKILLYTGGFEKGFDLALIDAGIRLGDEYVFFLNVYSRDGYLDEVVSHYSSEVAAGTIYFQTENLNEEEYDELVRSAHIGIVWYPLPTAANPNMYYLGFSSGKLNKFLSCGIPVVCSGGIHGYREMLEGHGIGRICSCAGELSAVLPDIEENYYSMTKHIEPFYREHMEFERCFDEVLSGIAQYKRTNDGRCMEHLLC